MAAATSIISDQDHSATDADAPHADAPRAALRRLAAPLVVVVALGLVVAACAPPGGSGGGAAGDVARAVNDDRGANGLGGLAVDPQLQDLAQSRAGEIASGGTLAHADLGGWLTLPWMSAWHSLGENLLVASPGTGGAAAEDAWMGSDTHRANILDGRFNRIGVGVVTDASGQVWYVALFGAR